MATQLKLEFKPSPLKDTPSSRLTGTEDEYQAFVPGCSDEDVIEWFTWMYGETPQEIVRTGGAVLVGPIP